MACHGIDGQKRDQNRGLFHVGLIFGVGAIDLVLPQFQPAGTTEHHVDDADVSDGGNEPLPPYEARAYAAEQHARQMTTSPTDFFFCNDGAYNILSSVYLKYVLFKISTHVAG